MVKLSAVMLLLKMASVFGNPIKNVPFTASLLFKHFNLIFNLTGLNNNMYVVLRDWRMQGWLL